MEVARRSTWEIMLRKGVKFHNGEDFNADAVKFTLDRVRVAGATQCLGGFTTIAEVRAIDPHTVQIVTKQPDPLLPARLAQWGAQMLPPGYFKEVGAEGLARKAVGTGPYRFGQWRKDDTLVFEANPAYWGDAPKFREYRSGPFKDELARVSALTAGEVDIAVNIPVDFTDQIKTGKGTYLAQTLAAATDVFLMGSDEALKSRDVRLALNLAIDRKKLMTRCSAASPSRSRRAPLLPTSATIPAFRITRMTPKRRRSFLLTQATLRALAS